MFAAGISAALAVVGAWLILRRSRRRIGDEPRCHKCDYILFGISSERCPECGTVIDPKKIVHGHRRCRRSIRVGAGLALLGLAVLISWRPAQEWSEPIYWYQYRPTYLVIRDLRQGSSQPPPKNNPLEQEMFGGNGALSEVIDRARVALDELQRRDKAGKLSSSGRTELDEIALAELTLPSITPVHEHLLGELHGRIVAGKLTPAQMANFYRRALTLSLSARSIVIQGDTVPVRVRYQTATPHGETMWEIVTIYKSMKMDGRAVSFAPSLTPDFLPHNLPGGWDIKDDRQVVCTSPGEHRLEIEVFVRFHPSERNNPAIHTETRTISASFRVVPASAESRIKLIDDPSLLSPLRASITPTKLRTNHMWRPGDVFGQISVSPPPVGFAFDVFARYNGREWPIGHIAHAAGGAPEDIRVDWEGEFPLPQPPFKIDLLLRGNPRLAAGTLDLYEIWNGEIILNDVSIEDEDARFGE